MMAILSIPVAATKAFLDLFFGTDPLEISRFTRRGQAEYFAMMTR